MIILSYNNRITIRNIYPKVMAYISRKKGTLISIREKGLEKAKNKNKKNAYL
jgi:hypothetical protein